MRGTKILRCIVILLFIWPSTIFANETNLESTTPEKKISLNQSQKRDTTAYNSFATKTILVKTNSVAWSMLVMNAAAEIDLSKNWSVNIPIYYSFFNYFSHRGKYRTFGTQPEFRYWFKDGKNGLFVGMHLSVFTFNYALWGDYRYQDHNGHTPLLGAGLNWGYRKNLTSDGKWRVEFSLGFGYAHIKYDKYINEYNGRLVSTEIKDFIGIDNVGVNFVYRLNLGGNKR